MPAIVFLVGILSIALLIGGGLISEKQFEDFILADAIMDVQINVATYHLRTEEALMGNRPAAADEAMAAMDQAIDLADAVLRGGKAGQHWISDPLKNPERRRQVAEVKSLVMTLRKLGLERRRNFDKTGSGSDLQQEFDAVFNEIQKSARELENTLEAEAAQKWLVLKRIFLGILFFWTLATVSATVAFWGRERQRKIADEKLREANEQLISQTEELTEHRKRLGELVDRRTAELESTVNSLNTEITERKETAESLLRTEKQIRHLSTRLLAAQEAERRRISMELHDALGQALNGIKLQIRAIEIMARADQTEMKKDCESLLEFMDNIIEDVRRLSLNLSPTILEDLGLTSALHWLIKDFEGNVAINMTCDMPDIDHLIPENQWIVIYRVIQEALSNIEKHAKADNVSIVIRQDEDRVVFLVEDNGKGFDLMFESMKSSGRGLGLTTMQERVKMIGGAFDIWSQKGSGTRLAFSVPVEKKGI